MRTKDEWGLFATTKTTKSPTHQYISYITDDVIPNASPQAGISFTRGVVWGDTLRLKDGNPGIDAYGGPPVVLNGGIGFVTGELGVSTNPITGEFTGTTVNYGVGGSIGLPAADISGYTANTN